MRKKIVSSLPFIIAILLGFGLRIYRLGTYGLWFDEVITIFQSEDIGAMHNSLIATPPLMIILVHLWRYLGQSDFVLRLLPMIFGLLSIFAIYKVGKTLFNQRVALLGAFLLSVSPFHIYYSQELRPYSLFTFLSLMSLHLLIRALKEDRFALWVGYVVFTALGLYAHYFSFLTLLSQQVIFLFFWIKKRGLIRKWLLSQFFIILLFLPWLPVFLKQLDPGFRIVSGYMMRPSAGTVLRTFRYFSLGYGAIKGQYPFALMLFGSTLGLSFISFKENRKGLATLWVFLLVPILSAFIISQFASIYHGKNFIAASTAYYLIVAVGISSVKKRTVQAFILIGIMLLLIPSLFNHYLNINNTPEEPGIWPKKGPREAALYIKSNLRPGDVIGLSQFIFHVPFEYYFNKRPELIDFVGSIGFFRSYTSFKSQFPALFKRWKDFKPVDIEEFVIRGERIWVVLPRYNVDGSPDATSRRIKEWMNSYCSIIDYKNFSGLEVFLYSNYKNLPR